MENNGVNAQALELARAFLAHDVAKTARDMFTRSQLEHLYKWSFDLWVPAGENGIATYAIDDQSFSKVLYAMVNGCHALSVKRGAELNWKPPRS